MYSKVMPQVWEDTKVRGHGWQVKMVWIYLLTNRHRNLIGLYRLPDSYAVEDLEDMTMAQFLKAKEILLKTGLIAYDAEARVLLIRNFLKPDYNPLENGNQVKAAIKKLEPMPDTPLFEELLGCIRQNWKPIYQPLAEYLEKRIAKTRETVAERVAETVTPTATGSVPATVGQTREPGTVTHNRDCVPGAVPSIDSPGSDEPSPPSGDTRNPDEPPPKGHLVRVWLHYFRAERSGEAACCRMVEDLKAAGYSSEQIEQAILEAANEKRKGLSPLDLKRKLEAKERDGYSKRRDRSGSGEAPEPESTGPGPFAGLDDYSRLQREARGANLP